MLKNLSLAAIAGSVLGRILARRRPEETSEAHAFSRRDRHRPSYQRLREEAIRRSVWVLPQQRLRSRPSQILKTPVDFTNRFRFSRFGVRFEPCQDFLEGVQSNEIPPRRGPRPARVVLDRTPTAPGSVVVAVLALEHRAPMERRCAPVALARPRHVRNRGKMPGRSGDDAPKERGIYRKFDRGLAVRGERRSPLQNELGLPTCAAERLSGILVFEREQPLRFGPIAMLAQWTNETPV